MLDLTGVSGEEGAIGVSCITTIVFCWRLRWFRNGVLLFHVFLWENTHCLDILMLKKNLIHFKKKKKKS
jgi:hypothetical protein